MRKIILLLFIACSAFLPSYAGLFDDIDREVEIEQITRVHKENMDLLNLLEKQVLYSMYESQIQQNSPQRIEYGYNAQGNYVPMYIGGQKIHYGYNSYGEFVPLSIGN